MDEQLTAVIPKFERQQISHPYSLSANCRSRQMPALRILPASSDTSCADHSKSCELAVGNPNVALSHVKVEIVNEFGRRHKRPDFTMYFNQNFLNVLAEKPLHHDLVGLLPKNPAMFIGDIRPLMRSRIEFGKLGQHQLVDSSGVHWYGPDVISMSSVSDMAGRPLLADLDH